MEEAWYKSRHTWIMIVSAIALILSFFKVQIDAATQSAIVDTLVNIATLLAYAISAILALWAKLKPKTPPTK